MIDLNKLERTLIIAEIGINHNGSLKNIFNMIEAAKEAGADAVKLQVMTGYDLVSPGLDFQYRTKRGVIVEKLDEMFNRFRTKTEWLEEIYEYSDKLGIICFATPFSFSTVKALEKVGNEIYKISSGDITHTPLIDYISKLNKPMIVSTGKSTLSDIDRVVRIIRNNNLDNFALLHCVSIYPTPYDQLNLEVITTLKRTFDVTVGFSDHSIGYLSSTVAVVKGARIIEKHFTLDKNLEGPDHWFSLDRKEFSDLVKNIRLVESMIGSGQKDIYDNEKNVNLRATRSIVASRDILIGSRLEERDIDYKRPGYGLEPYNRDLLIGKKVNRNIRKDEIIGLSDLVWKEK